MIALEVLNWGHLKEAASLGWPGWRDWTDNRLRYLTIVGFAGREGEKLLGIGGVVWFGSKATGCFRITEEFRAEPRSRWIHRHALRVLEAAHMVSPIIYAKADPRIPRARAFLERLGFTSTDERNWTHGPGDADRNRLVRYEQRSGDWHGGIERDGGAL